MRDYILTPSEKQIIKDYLENNKKLEGFYTLLHRCRKQNSKVVMADLELIKQFLAKAGNSTSGN